MITRLSQRLRYLMAERGWTIQTLAKIADLPEETVRNIYYARTPDPKISTIMKLAKAFNISVNCLMGECEHTSEERVLLRNYRDCGKHGKAIIELVAKYEASAVSIERDAKGKHKIPCIVPRGDTHKGIIYETCETVEIETGVDEAYIAIEITNNALSPTYCKGDVLLFENRFPDNGEIASFYKVDRMYIRRFIEEDGHYRLKCLHQQGEDMIYKRMDEIEYIGTCIGAIRS